MKANITKEDVLALKAELLDYADNRAEQHEFPLIAIIHRKNR